MRTLLVIMVATAALVSGPALAGQATSSMKGYVAVFRLRLSHRRYGDELGQHHRPEQGDRQRASG